MSSELYGGLGEAFDKLKSGVFPRYKGCIIERVSDGFKWGGKSYPTIEEAKEAIDKAFVSFGNNVKQ